MEEKEFDTTVEDDAMLLAEDIPDFPEQEATYHVVVYGYDEDGNSTGYTLLLDKFDDPDQAISYASNLNYSKLQVANYPADVRFIELCVETIINVDGFEEPAGSIFKTSGKILRK